TEEQRSALSEGTVVWATEAQAMLKKVPFFVRGRVQKNVEQYAREHGHATVTVDVLQAARETFGG
ncbi:MAG TPA: ferredoxin:protochlorophyllide reductase (ATP-dependent) subunit B, partial [Roseiflexaceae bacterium]|nr:ferredoxin:protochlorophyllide reductase (ATP-dependent) subunit B [Roseiflexaceae bacterium]